MQSGHQLRNTMVSLRYCVSYQQLLYEPPLGLLLFNETSIHCLEKKKEKLDKEATQSNPRVIKTICNSCLLHGTTQRQREIRHMGFPDLDRQCEPL